MSRRQYPRIARVNEVLREVLAETLEEVADEDERLELVTITGVQADPDLHHATVYYTARHEGAGDALSAARTRLQGAIAREVRLKRTPQLSFAVDPGVTSGWRVEEILKGISRHDGERD